MYIAELSDGDRAWLSAAAAVDLTLSRDSEATTSAAAITRVVELTLRELLTIPEALIARRITVDPSAAPRCVLFATVPGQWRTALERTIGLLTRLELQSCTVSLSPDPDHFDSLRALDLRHPYRLVAPPTVERAGARLVSGFRPATMVEPLMQAARELGIRFCHQASAQCLTLPRVALRNARLNLAAAQLADLPDTALAAQSETTQRLLGAAVMVEHAMAVETDEAAEWLVRRVRALAADYYRVTGLAGFALSPLEPDAALDSLINGVPSLDFAAIEDEAVLRQHAATSDEVTQALLIPQTALDGVWRAPRSAFADETVSAGTSLPAVPARLPDRSFAFISYSRRDAAHAEQVVKALSSAGIAVWYDRELPAGEEWDTVLEARVAACGALVLLLSPAAVASRYVRREIKYADSLDKQVIVLQLEPTELSHGLAFALHRIQRVDLQQVGALQAALPQIGRLLQL